MQKNVPTIITSCVHFRASDIVELSAQLTDVDKGLGVKSSSGEEKPRGLLPWPDFVACMATGGTAHG